MVIKKSTVVFSDSNCYGDSVFIHTSILPTLLTIQNSGNRAIIHRRTMNYSYPLVITISHCLL